MTIKLIVACDHSNGIARDGEMPWNLPSDLKRFKSLTMGSPVVMGRKTFETLNKPLPGRLNVVVTHDDGFISSQPKRSNVTYYKALETALLFHKDCWVIGGESIYKQSFPLADMIFLTDIWDDFGCDQFFPAIDNKEWFCYSDSDVDSHVENGVEHRYMIYVKKK